MRNRRKRKTVWAYLDGKKLVDVVQAALDNNMMVDDMKALLIKENPGHEVTFKDLMMAPVVPGRNRPLRRSWETTKDEAKGRAENAV